MDTLDRLKILRNHLSEHYAWAQDWIAHANNRRGVPCLMVIRTSDGGYVADKQVFTVLCGSPPAIMARHGKDGLLELFDRTIARLEEHVLEPAQVAELADAPGSKSDAIEGLLAPRHVGSSPTLGTNLGTVAQPERATVS